MYYIFYNLIMLYLQASTNLSKPGKDTSSLNKPETIDTMSHPQHTTIAISTSRMEHFSTKTVTSKMESFKGNSEVLSSFKPKQSSADTVNASKMGSQTYTQVLKETKLCTSKSNESKIIGSPKLSSQVSCVQLHKLKCFFLLFIVEFQLDPLLLSLSLFSFQ